MASNVVAGQSGFNNAKRLSGSPTPGRSASSEHTCCVLPAVAARRLLLADSSQQRSTMHKRTLSHALPMCAGLVLALGLTIGAAGQATSPQTPDQSSQPQAAPAQPAPPAQSVPPSQQAQPANQAPPSGSAQAQSSSGSASAQASQGGQAPSIDDELQLTPDQKQKIAAVVEDENKQIDAVRNDNSLSLEKKQQKVLQIRQEGSPKIKAILTPEQLQKLAAIQQRMRQQQTQPPPQQ